jgi:DNA-binding response OmpR family regulator
MSDVLGTRTAWEMFSATALPRHVVARNYVHQWTEATGAHLLVVDPFVDGEPLRESMARRGIHVTWVESAVDGLIEFGRTNPSAVVIAPEVTGLPATQFVASIRRYAAPFVVASLATPDAPDAGALLLAGAGAAVTRPYTAETLWRVLQQSNHALDDHARVSFGPLELDARAYTVHVNGERIADLPLKEFELLRALIYRAPEVVSDAELRQALWGAESSEITGNTLAVHAGRLRNRLADAARIRRVRGRGYALTFG